MLYIHRNQFAQFAPFNQLIHAVIS